MPASALPGASRRSGHNLLFYVFGPRPPARGFFCPEWLDRMFASIALALALRPTRLRRGRDRSCFCTFHRACGAEYRCDCITRAELIVERARSVRFTHPCLTPAAYRLCCSHCSEGTTATNLQMAIWLTVVALASGAMVLGIESKHWMNASLALHG